VHWCSPETGDLMERCLAVREFPVPHTAEETARLVKVVLQEFAVPEERCKFAVTDNCSVMEACVTKHFPIGRTKRFHCVAHWLQLCISDALKRSGALDAVGRVREYVKKVLRRDKWWQRLAALQLQEYKTRKQPLKLFLDGGVRWSALFLMCERISEVELAILQHLRELLMEQQDGKEMEKDSDDDEEGDGRLHVKAGDLEVVRQMVPLLRPLYDATNNFQGDGDVASISVIIPEVLKLLKHLRPGPLTVSLPEWVKENGKTVKVKDAVVLQEEEVKPEVVRLRAELLTAVKERFGSGSALDVKGLTAFYYAATFLDHRKRDLKTIQYANPLKCQNTRDFMADSAARYLQWEEQLTAARAQAEQLRQQQREGAGGAVKEKEGGEGEGDGDEVLVLQTKLSAEEREAMLHEALADDTEEAGGVGGDGGESGGDAGARRVLSYHEHVYHAHLELERWMKLRIASLKGPPLVRWALPDMRRKFPYMSGLARRLLSIPASSAGAERVFSQSGLTLGELRQSLGTRTLEDLMVLKYHHADGHVYKTPKQWADFEGLGGQKG